MSRTPESDICMVRGMGVAESVSTSMDSRRFFSCSLCPTPKRCSSSMMTRPRSCGFTSRESRRCGAHEHGDAALRESLERLLLLLGRAKAREHLHLHAEGLEAVFEAGVVLLRQDRGRAEHHDLLAVLRGLERRSQGHLGLAEAHVAADQAVHGGARTACRPSRRRWRPAGRPSPGRGRTPPSRAATACRANSGSPARRRGACRRPPDRTRASSWPCAPS